jgi:hypothetical protein
MEAPVFCFVNIWMTIFFVWGPSPSLCVPDIKSWTFGDEKKCVVSLILVKRVSKSFFVQGIKLFKIVGVECSNIWRGRVGHFWRSHLLQPLEKWKSRSFWRSSRYFYIKKNCSKIWNFKIKYHRCPKSQQVEKLSQFWSWRTWQNGESSCHNESRIVSDGWISNVGRGCSSFDKKTWKRSLLLKSWTSVQCDLFIVALIINYCMCPKLHPVEWHFGNIAACFPHRGQDVHEADGAAPVDPIPILIHYTYSNLQVINYFKDYF